MRFMVPDWDERVDPGYDFRTERFSLVRDPHRDDRYGHELYADRIYDGILVSRMALGESGPKRELVERHGMRAYLRLPTDLTLLGDCGAFGYLRDTHPRFDPVELVAYYERLGFDYGVSVDHMIVPAVQDQRAARYEITLANADRFLCEHRDRACSFVPIGALQGWDVASYVAGARALVEMGYDYLAIGGLARSNTRTVRQIVAAVVGALPLSIRLHVFGVARLSLLETFLELGVTSIDSAAPLRQAWLSATDNYYTLERNYAAIRIPLAEQERPKSQSLVGRSGAPLSDLRAAEGAALAAVRDYAAGQTSLAQTLKQVMIYDELLGLRLDGQNSESRRALYRETLRARPWARCPCRVCQELGVEVIIFRGNNRNRRRGFHNLWVTQQRLARLRRNRERTFDD